ncbi:MAG: hypothetical protein LBJ73_00870 [Rickettsiales bacterium]|nr:hypothetical protein [Rickettsiales bacterium]
MSEIINLKLFMLVFIGMATVVLSGPSQAEIASKSYVDSLAAAGGGTIGGGSVPSWAVLKDANWVSPNWGDIWEVVSADGAYKAEGVAACLSTKDKSGNAPADSAFGANCWCKILAVNNVIVSGAWVFAYTDTLGASACYARCAFDCSFCVRNNGSNSCTRAALFATQ